MDRPVPPDSAASHSARLPPRAVSVETLNSKQRYQCRTKHADRQFRYGSKSASRALFTPRTRGWLQIGPMPQYGARNAKKRRACISLRLALLLCRLQPAGRLRRNGSAILTKRTRTLAADI
jgi:hypothetical protein